MHSSSVQSCNSAYHVVVINSITTACPVPRVAARMLKRGCEVRGVAKSVDFFPNHEEFDTCMNLAVKTLPNFRSRIDDLSTPGVLVPFDTGYIQWFEI